MDAIYLISLLRNDTNKRKVLATDKESGGHYYWSDSIQRGKHFKSVEECKAVISSSDFTKDIKMSDGAIHPPLLVHNGLGICNNNPHNSGVIEIAQLSIKILSSTPISAKI